MKTNNHKKDELSQVEIVQKLPLHEVSRWKSDQYYLYCSSAYDKKIIERSFELVSKDKLAIRRRAAFDTDEKDVTKKDVKTPSYSS